MLPYPDTKAAFDQDILLHFYTWVYYGRIHILLSFCLLFFVQLSIQTFINILWFIFVANLLQIFVEPFAILSMMTKAGFVHYFC